MIISPSSLYAYGAKGWRVVGTLPETAYRGAQIVLEREVTSLPPLGRNDE